MKAFKKIQAAVSPVLLTLTIFIIPFVVVYSGLGETNDKRWGDTDNSLNSSIQRSTPQLQSLLHHKVAQKTKVISKPSIPLVQNHIHYHYGVNSPETTEETISRQYSLAFLQLLISMNEEPYCDHFTHLY